MFSGSNYIAQYDEKRLTKQYEVIFSLMKDGVYRTLGEIEKLTGYPQASISAQMRHARKLFNGNHTVNKRARGERENGLWEYQLIVNQKQGKQVEMF